MVLDRICQGQGTGNINRSGADAGLLAAAVEKWHQLDVHPLDQQAGTFGGSDLVARR